VTNAHDESRRGFASRAKRSRATGSFARSGADLEGHVTIEGWFKRFETSPMPLADQLRHFKVI